jgi:hypothetical protein
MCEEVWARAGTVYTSIKTAVTFTFKSSHANTVVTFLFI